MANEEKPNPVEEFLGAVGDEELWEDNNPAERPYIPDEHKTAKLGGRGPKTLTVGKRTSKYGVGDTVFYATTEMLYNRIPPEELYILTVSFDRRKAKFKYRCMPIAQEMSIPLTEFKYRYGHFEVDTECLPIQSSYRTEDYTVVKERSLSYDYYEWELLTKRRMQNRIKQVCAELQEAEKKKMEEARARGGGGRLYAMFRYKANRGVKKE